MKKVNVTALKSNLSALLDYVEKGKELQIERRNVAIAKIVPIKASVKNHTKLGIGKGTIEFKGDIL